MTLQELRYIIALERYGHFGKAAEHCFVSQPTLSLAIKKFEDELNLCLFERSKHKVVVTPVGAKIVEQAKIVVAQADRIKEIASSGSDALSSPLRIGAIYTIGPYLFPHLLPQLKVLAPDMPLIIEETYTAVLRQRLSNYELDAIIIALPFNEPDVVVKTLYEEPFVVLLPNKHPLAQQSSIRKAQLDEEPVLLLGEGHCFRDQVLEACPSLDHKNDKPSLLPETTGTSLETIKHMVASGMGITILPLSAAGIHPYNRDLLTIRPVADNPPTRQVASAWRASFPRFAAIDAISKAITQCQMLPE